MARRFARVCRAVSCISAVLLLCAGCARQPFGDRGDLVLDAVFAPPFSAPESLEQPDYVDFSVSRFLYGDLSEVQRQAYRAIHNAAGEQPERIRIPALTEEELSGVLLAVRYDNPYLVCFSTGYSFSRIGKYYALEPQYLAGAEESRARAAALVSAAKTLLADADPAASPFEKELLAHDVLCSRCAYAEGPLAATAYGALVEGRAVCEGYALAQKLLLDLSGVESVAVPGNAAPNGEAPVPHLWNAALLDTGWYFLDSTWDDPVADDGSESVRHFYFNLSEAELRRTHSGFSLPAGIVCDRTAENYHRVKGLFCTEENWRAVASRVIGEARAGESAELRFSSAALLDSVCTELFENGLIHELGAGGNWRRFTYSADPGACGLFFTFLDS